MDLFHGGFSIRTSLRSVLQENEHQIFRGRSMPIGEPNIFMCMRLSMYDVIVEDTTGVPNNKSIDLDGLEDFGSKPSILSFDYEPEKSRIKMGLRFFLDVSKTNLSKDVLQKLINSIRRKLNEFGINSDSENPSIIKFSYFAINIYIEDGEHEVDLEYPQNFSNIRRKITWQEYTPKQFFDTDILSNLDDNEIPKFDLDFEKWFNLSMKSVNKSILVLSKLKFRGRDLSDLTKFLKPEIKYDNLLTKEDSMVLYPHFIKKVTFMKNRLSYNKTDLEFSDELIEFIERKLKQLGVDEFDTFDW